jgi:hypothetical protein
MKNINTPMCHCGKPLHYTNSMAFAYTQACIDKLGEYISVVSSVTNKTYKVPRHYIALHGLAGNEIHKLGFKEIKTDET